MSDDVFRYTGTIYVRPLGRGIVLENLPDGAPQLEDQLDDGYYQATIVITGPRTAKP